jgi:hypothetical protein
MLKKTANLRLLLSVTFILLSVNILSSDHLFQYDRDSLILEYVKNGNLEDLRKILGDDADVNKRFGRRERTLLTYAIENEQLETTAYLLSKGADIEEQDGTKTPLMFAARYGNVELTKLLLDSGADINSINDDRNTAFHYAAKYNNLEVLKILYENGAKINIPNNDQWTALDYSIINNSPVIRQYLDSIGCMLFEKNLPDYFDGPYISYVDDSTIRVDYMKNSKRKKESSILSKEFEIERTAEFNGLKKDKKKYRIIKEPVIPASKYDMPSKIFVMGDIHGQYKRMIEMLTVGGVIDKKTDWNFGDGHLVFIGDISDRGDGVMEAYWLIYKLEQQAEKVGGKVHLLIGNHEAMILKNDIRYISNKYYGLTSNLDIEYHKLFSDNTIIGRWLRSKNVVEKIGNTLFVHAGISPELAGRNMSLEEINTAFRHFLNQKDESSYTQLDKFIISSYGPVWYRGYLRGSGPYEAIEQSTLESILKDYNVEQVVVGHTEVDLINPINKGRVYPVNIPLADKEIIGQALIIDGQFYRLDTDNKLTKLEN